MQTNCSQHSLCIALRHRWNQFRSPLPPVRHIGSADCHVVQCNSSSHWTCCDGLIISTNVLPSQESQKYHPYQVPSTFKTALLKSTGTAELSSPQFSSPNLGDANVLPMDSQIPEIQRNLACIKGSQDLWLPS